MKRIKNMPMALAIAIMVLCIATGVLLGNRNAIKGASAESQALFQEIGDLATQRVDIAEHRMLLLMKRYLPEDDATKSLDRAVEQSRRAKKPGEMAKTNLALETAAQSALNALNALSADAIRETDLGLAVGAMDDMISYQKILLRRADAYNNGLGEIQKICRNLPAKWLLKGLVPEVYQ